MFGICGCIFFIVRVLGIIVVLVFMFLDVFVVFSGDYWLIIVVENLVNV